MADYISREAVLALETDLHFDGIEQLKYWRCHHIDPTKVKILPAADVRPVVHGTWIDKCIRDWHCSVCDYGIQKIRVHDGYCYKDLPNFCPNCGADMREETDA